MRTVRRSVIAALALLAAAAPLAARADDGTVHLPEGRVGPNTDGDRCAGAAPHYEPLELSADGPAIPPGAQPILRFVQLSDSHVIDDDGPAIANGTPTELVLDPAVGNSAATFLNEEFTDEVLNAAFKTINACNTPSHPLALTITTGDITDTNWLNVTRRVIDNIDAQPGQLTAFEQNCGYIPHEGDCPIPADLLAIPTGRLVADSQAQQGDQGPVPETDATYQWGTARAMRQALETAAAGAQQGTTTIAAGLPPALQADGGLAGLDVPYYAVFGNHDVAVKGTVTYQGGFEPALLAHGRYFFQSKREFINEWFATTSSPVGHGFNNATDEDRWTDPNKYNDGWYSFTQDGLDGTKFRFITLDTTFDGVDQAAHSALNAPGTIASNPTGLEAGFMSHEQFTWLQGELAAAATADPPQPVLIFSHHPDRSFIERQYSGEAARVETTAAEIDALLGQATHGGSPSTVVGWVAGHTHANRVNPCRVGNCPIGDGSPTEVPIARPFWRFETASLINWPQEGRIIEVFKLADNSYALRLTMISPDQNDSAARRSRDLSGYEDMCSVRAMFTKQTMDFCSNGAQLTVDDNNPAGGIDDRDVDLLP